MKNLFFLPKSYFNRCLESADWSCWLLAVLSFSLGAGLPLGLAEFTFSYSVFTALLFLPFCFWLLGSFTGNERIGYKHLVWLIYTLLLIIFLILAPLGWFPGFYEVWQPLFWAPWGFLAVGLSLWLSQRLTRRYLNHDPGELFYLTDTFKYQALIGCYYAGGIILLTAWVPLWTLRRLDLNYHFPLLLVWTILAALVFIRITYLAARNLFKIDLPTSILFSLWPFSLSGYWLLYPVDEYDVLFRHLPVYLIQNILGSPEYAYPLGGVILLFFGGSDLFYRWAGSTRSRFIRPLLSSLVIGGLCVLGLAVFTLIFATLVLSPPKLYSPDWVYEAQPTAEQNFKELDQFARRINLDPEAARSEDDFDTKTYLTTVNDTLQAGKKLLSRPLLFPRDYLKHDTIPATFSLIDLGRIVKLKSLYLLNRGKYEQVLRETNFLTEAANNLTESRTVLIGLLGTIKIKNLTLDIQENLKQKNLSPKQRRQLQTQLLDAGAWPISPGFSWFTGTISLKSKWNESNFILRLFERKYSPQGPLRELRYLTLNLLGSSEQIRKKMIDRYHRLGSLLDTPYYRIDWQHAGPPRRKHLLGYILDSPCRPLAGYYDGQFTPQGLKRFSKTTYSVISRTRKLLHANKETANAKLAPLPRAFHWDPMTGKLIND